MADYEYKVVAAPRRTKSFKGVRSHEDQFAHVLMEVMNDLAREDWEYVRAESLPCEEKTGLTSRVVGYQTVLVFRRSVKSGQRFFTVPEPRRIEHHDIPEDSSEAEVHPSRQSPSRVTTSTDSDASALSSRSGILHILQQRRATGARDESDAYAANTNLAAE